MSRPLKPEPAFTIPPLIKRNTFLLAVTQAFVGVGNQMVPTLGALMVMQLLRSAALAGIGTSILSLSRVLVSYPVGKVMDAYGRRAGLVLGLGLGLVGTLFLGLSIVWTSFPLFLAGLLTFGLGIGAAHQLRLAAADMYPPSRRAEGLGYVLTGSLVGALGGPVLISVAQASSSSFEMRLALPWFFVPAVIVPSIALVLLIRPDPREIATHLEKYYPGYRPPPVEDGERHSDASIGAFLRHYPKQVAFVASFAVQGNMTMMMTMTALVLDHHGHQLPAISLAVAIHSMGMFGLSLPLGRLADLVGRRAVMLLGILLAGSGSLLVPITPDYWVVTAGIFLVGVGWSCVNVASSALIADTTGPLERGRAIGTNDTVSSTSAVVLPLLGGSIVEFLGFPALGILGASLMIVPCILLLRLKEISPGKYRETTSLA